MDSVGSTKGTSKVESGDVTPRSQKKAVVIGGGPVGALAAMYFSKMNWDVEIYELRPDPRSLAGRAVQSKSINLAISERGLNSLKVVDPLLLEEVLKETVPMIGRCIHPGKGNFKGKGGGESQKYDIHGRFIQSADRARLNIILLDWVAKEPNVKIFFEHALRKLDLDKKYAEFEQRSTKETVTVNGDFFVGSDGAHSTTRRFLQRYILMDYEQVYIDTMWKELEILPEERTGGFRIDGNHLHIWPRKDFMFIAIPSPDYTFTCTLFMPQKYFDEIGDTREGLLKFFNKHFPDVITLIGEEKLVEDYFRTSKLPLISIKCSPYHYSDRCVIVGDAAHAMVPFYGQGMNSGFEDVRVLFDHIKAHPHDLALALRNYSAERKLDAHTINDLAMRNYIEMSADVTSRWYKFRKATEELLYAYLPWMGVRTMYSMVSFSNIRYSEVVARVRWQSGVLNRVSAVLGMGMIGVIAMGASRFRWWWGPMWAEGVMVSRGIAERGLGLIRSWVGV
ncbi:hypothetical protein BDZ91DRAFT_834349 [Kalaharituber pfeilii]|nr:hypothetical protein BDZ91DRAFT_834349 [Kalaharituber pfeilii]